MEKFHKKKYNKELIVQTATNLKYTTQITEFLNKQFKQPDEDFIRYILKKIYPGKLTSTVMEKFKPLIMNSISLCINELLDDKLKSLKAIKKEELKDKIVEPISENEEIAKGMVQSYKLNNLKSNKLHDSYAENEFTIEELIQKDSSGQKPIQLKLPDGNILPVHKWRDIVEKISLWLYEQKKLKTNHCPIEDYAGKNRFFLNISPLHPTGKPFTNIINIYNKIYGEVNYSSINHLKNLMLILNKIGENPQGYKIIIQETGKK